MSESSGEENSVKYDTNENIDDFNVLKFDTKINMAKIKDTSNYKQILSPPAVNIKKS